MPDSRKTHQERCLTHHPGDSAKLWDHLSGFWKAQKNKEAINFPKIVQTGFPGGSQAGEQAGFWKWKMQPCSQSGADRLNFCRQPGTLAVRHDTSGHSVIVGQFIHLKDPNLNVDETGLDRGQPGEEPGSAGFCLTPSSLSTGPRRNEVTQLGFKSRLLQLHYG